MTNIKKVFSGVVAIEGIDFDLSLIHIWLETAPYQAILNFMDASPDSCFSAEELAKAAGLSKVAVRRYLNEMLEVQDIVSSVEMNGGPRPVMRYRRMERESI